MEHIPGYDAWKTTSPDDPEPVEHCDICGAPIYEGDYSRISRARSGAMNA